MDEQPVRLFKETRTPIPATRPQARRVDYEYERAGVANIFMFSCPLGCWRRVSVRERKTKMDWAFEIKILSEVARALSRRLEIIPTPKHGSWLNIAENELSALTVQCVRGIRFVTIEELRVAVEAWAAACNANKGLVRK